MMHMANLIFADDPSANISRDRTMRSKRAKKRGWRSVSLTMEPTNKLWFEEDDVVVAFNLPRITTILERLMGTNVVRLTDREYMKTLRDRIDQDYCIQLEKRIRNRELKEVERERLLIIEGKCNEIPKELIDDPIFVVNREVEKEILYQRSKACMKTSREKNTNRLRHATHHWDRERDMRDEEQSKRNIEATERKTEEKRLEDQYQREDDERGMDLLRYIYTTRGRDPNYWRPCEQSLKHYLESERARMKAREHLVPKQFTSDPLDLRNVMTTRAAELKAKRKLEREEKRRLAAEQASSRSEVFEMGKSDGTIRISGQATQDDTTQDHHKLLGDSDDSLLTDDLDEEEGSTLSESVKQHAEKLDEEIAQDIKKGFIISRAQYEDLRYEEMKITKLRQARNINELYQIAEDIILGERLPEEPEVEEEVEPEGEEEGEEEEDESELDF